MTQEKHRECTYTRQYNAKSPHDCELSNTGGRGQNRTADTRIFNPIISIGISLYLTSILA